MVNFQYSIVLEDFDNYMGDFQVTRHSKSLLKELRITTE